VDSAVRRLNNKGVLCLRGIIDLPHGHLKGSGSGRAHTYVHPSELADIEDIACCQWRLSLAELTVPNCRRLVDEVDHACVRDLHHESSLNSLELVLFSIAHVYMGRKAGVHEPQLGCILLSSFLPPSAFYSPSAKDGRQE
jgi:hypothetical protein